MNSIITKQPITFRLAGLFSIIVIIMAGIPASCVPKDGFSGITTLRLYCDFDSDHNEILAVDRAEDVTFHVEINGPSPSDSDGHVALYRETTHQGPGAPTTYDQEGYFLVDNGLKEADREVSLPDGASPPNLAEGDVVPNKAGSYSVHAWLWNSVNNNNIAPYQKVWSNITAGQDPTVKTNSVPNIIKVVKEDLLVNMPKVLDTAETEIAELDEDTKGSVSFVNNDNDDNDGIYDNADSEVAGGDDELIKVKIRMQPTNLHIGAVRLQTTTGGSAVKIWKSCSKNEEYSPNSDILVSDLTVEGDYLVKTLWIEGITPQTTALATQLKAVYYRFSIQEDQIQDTAAISILGINSVEWIGRGNSLTDTNVLDNDPNWPATLLPIGARVFPDARSNSEGVVEANSRDQVDVKVTLSASTPWPINVHLRSFDVDDPTADTWPLDDPQYSVDPEEEEPEIQEPTSESFENDNRATTENRAGHFVDEGSNNIKALAISAGTNSGIAQFQVTMQPGDNFKVASHADKDFLENLENLDGVLNIFGTTTDERNSNKQRITNKGKKINELLGPPSVWEIRDSDKYCSKTLTVWRFLHIEMDSRTAPGDSNTAVGSVHKITSDGQMTFAYGVQIDPNLNQNIPLDKSIDPGRFEHGWAILGEGNGDPGVTTTNNLLKGMISTDPEDFANDLYIGFKDNPNGIIAPYRLSKQGKIDITGTIIDYSRPLNSIWVKNDNITAGYVGGTINIAGIAMNVTGITDIMDGGKLIVQEISVQDGHNTIPARMHDDDDDTVLPRSVANPVSTLDASWMLDSDNKLNNRFAPAYIRPKYDGGGNSAWNTSTVDFVENSPIPIYDAQGKVERFQNFTHWDSRANRSERFWSIYLLAGFQSSLSLWDPDETLASNKMNADPDAEEVIIGMAHLYDIGSAELYLETIREAKLEPDLESPITLEKRILVHEVGHLLSCDHNDTSQNDLTINGIMNAHAGGWTAGTVDNLFFIPNSQNIMRCIDKPKLPIMNVPEP